MATRQPQPDRRRSIVVLLILLLLWSLCLGIGLAQATEPRPLEAIAQVPSTPDPVIPTAASDANGAIGTVDVVPEKFKSGQQLYLENCGTCHLALPPAIMPSETWRDLIQDPQHYGTEIKPLGIPNVQIEWQYLREYSRPRSGDDEPVPYRIYQSRLFKALHPRVKFTQRVNLDSCISCHPGAGNYDFRRLSAEWQNAP